MFRALGARLTLDHKGVSGVALLKPQLNEPGSGERLGLKTATDLFAEGELHESGRQRQRVAV